MAETGRLTKEEWDDLEAHLVGAENAVHTQFMESAEAKELMGETDKTPGYLLLHRLRELNDGEAVRLFRAVEMYHHELSRADIAAAYLRGKEVGRREAGNS
jgi:hypothetical protein